MEWWQGGLVILASGVVFTVLTDNWLRWLSLPADPLMDELEALFDD